MYNLGKLLKELREEKNVSMDKMVEDLKNLHDVNIAKSTISKWENNKADPSMEYARILIKYFNVSLDYLLGISKYKNKEEELHAYKNEMNAFSIGHNKNFYENKLLNSFNKLNDEGKNEAIKRVDELTELNKYKKEEGNKIVELPKKEKQIWEDPDKEYLMPKASHDKDGEFTEEEYKYDDNLMNNDNLWK